MALAAEAAPLRMMCDVHLKPLGGDNVQHCMRPYNGFRRLKRYIFRGTEGPAPQALPMASLHRVLTGEESSEENFEAGSLDARDLPDVAPACS